LEGLNEVATCDSVIERAGEALRVALNEPTNLLIIALNHLTLARAILFKADLTLPLPCSVHDHISAVLEGLRAAGSMDHLPRGLLTRAWIGALSGDEPGCRADLDEASEIVERGPMPLFQVDIQLTRARLFRDRTALTEARRLIAKHGYHRRDRELADAWEAARNW
jgi:hypothetical protein